MIGMMLGTIFSIFSRYRLDHELDHSEELLFYVLLGQINWARGEDNNLLNTNVEIGNRKMELISRMSTKQIHRARNGLSQKGIISFSCGVGKKNYAKYRLGPYFDNYKDEGKTDKLDIGTKVNDIVNVQVYDKVNDQLNVQLNDQLNVQLMARKTTRKMSNDKHRYIEHRTKNLDSREENLEISDKTYVPAVTETRAPRPESTPYEEIATQFMDICVDLPRIKEPKNWTTQRKTAVRTLWDKNNSLQWFIGLFERVQQSDFLAGKTGSFRASFDWILKPANLQKILEGNYDNRDNSRYKYAGLQSFLADAEAEEAIKSGVK